MAILVSTHLLDSAPDRLIAEGDTVHILNEPQVTYTDVLANSLGEYPAVITKGDSNEDGGGRRAIIASAVGVPVLSGQFNHYAIVNDTDDMFLYLGEGGGEDLTSNIAVITPEFSINFSDGVISEYS